jgi:pSer/pThr/pTyr-binding forkhead associated (FHA) protein
MAFPPHSLSPAELASLLEAERKGEAFLAYRDGDGDLRLGALDRFTSVTIGRGEHNDFELPWDGEVSRTHAQLVQVGEEWTLVDDGLSRNGSFLNGERIHGRRRLVDGDTLVIGSTALTFHSPTAEVQAGTAIATDSPVSVALSDTQRRVLVVLCRPYKDGAAFASPATNQQIAEELFLSVDAVKTHLRVLFAKFGIEGLPQNQKRARLVERAFHSGAITGRDL